MAASGGLLTSPGPASVYAAITARPLPPCRM